MKLVLAYNVGVVTYDEISRAIARNEVEVLERILNPETCALRDRDGTTGLMDAICSQHPTKELVALFLDRGSDVNSVRSNGFTPLHLAAQDQRLEILELLLERGADVHAKDAWGQTPLLRWVFHHGRNLEIGKLLMKYGSDPNVQYMSGASAIQHAKDQWDEEALAVLENREPRHKNWPEVWRVKPVEAGHVVGGTFEFTSWPGDPIVTGDGKYLLMSKVVNWLKKNAVTGAEFLRADFTVAPELAATLKKPIPKFAWLAANGKVAEDDFAIAEDGELVISNRVMSAIQVDCQEMHWHCRRYAFE